MKNSQVTGSEAIALATKIFVQETRQIHDCCFSRAERNLLYSRCARQERLTDQFEVETGLLVAATDKR